MTELELYKFIRETGSECCWWMCELILFVHGTDIRDLAKLLGIDYGDNAPAYITPDGYIAIDLVEYCELYEINPLNITTEGFNWDKYKEQAEAWKEFDSTNH